MSHWQTTIGSPNTAEKYRRPNRGTRRYKTDLIISKQCRNAAAAKYDKIDRRKYRQTGSKQR